MPKKGFPEQRGHDAKSVFEPDIAIDHASTTQPADSLPAAINDSTIATITWSKEQNVEISAEQSRLHCRQELHIVRCHLMLKVLKDVKNLSPLVGKVTRDAGLTLTVIIDNVARVGHSAHRLQQRIDYSQVLVEHAHWKTQIIEYCGLEQTAACRVGERVLIEHTLDSLLSVKHLNAVGVA